MRKIVLLTAGIAAVLLAGCGGGDDKSGTSASDGSLARVQHAGKLTVCSSNDVPYAYRDAKDKQLKGTDIEMVRAIARQLRIGKVELYEVPISGIISALKSRRCDLIADNIAINQERSKQISFSAPMYRAGQALVVPKGNPAHILSQEDFHGHTVGSYLGTIQLEYLRELAKKDSSIKVKAYKNIPEVIADLKAGRLDAAVFDDMVAGYSLKDDPSLGIEIVPAKLPIGDYAVGAGFRNEDRSLRYAFNDAARQLQRDGQLSSILRRWGMVPVDRYLPFPNCCPAPAA
jgi:polar amino acid transport system substrate-binding protein